MVSTIFPGNYPIPNLSQGIKNERNLESDEKFSATPLERKGEKSALRAGGGGLYS